MTASYAPVLGRVQKAILLMPVLFVELIPSYYPHSLCLENAQKEKDKEHANSSGQTTRHTHSSTADGLIHCSELNRAMQEMMGHYVKLEEYYMMQSVKKVYSPPKLLSCVDYFSYG